MTHTLTSLAADTHAGTLHNAWVGDQAHTESKQAMKAVR